MLISGSEQVSAWYVERLRRYGEAPRAVGFNRLASQLKRFEALCALGDFHSRRLLDAGCGLGDFLTFLLGRNVVPDYHGLDLCPAMVERCRDRFEGRPGLGCRFEEGDALEHAPARPYDFVVASGLFSLGGESAQERIAPTLERLFACCTRGLAANFLSRRAEARAPHNLFVEPERILELALRLTPSVKLDHSYLPHDFTVYLYKTPARAGGETSDT